LKKRIALLQAIIKFSTVIAIYISYAAVSSINYNMSINMLVIKLFSFELFFTNRATDDLLSSIWTKLSITL